jgi:hypothetical protein
VSFRQECKILGAGAGGGQRAEVGCPRRRRRELRAWTYEWEVACNLGARRADASVRTDPARRRRSCGEGHCSTTVRLGDRLTESFRIAASVARTGRRLLDEVLNQSIAPAGDPANSAEPVSRQQWSRLPTDRAITTVQPQPRDHSRAIVAARSLRRERRWRSSAISQPSAAGQ